jgi:hypothetical protein
VNSQVQIFTFPPRIVWYEPTGFPDIETDGELINIDGDTLTVFKGWCTETISAAQVKRIVSVKAAETTELRDTERV